MYMDDDISRHGYGERKEEIEYIGPTAQRSNGFQVSGVEWSIWPPSILLT